MPQSCTSYMEGSATVLLDRVSWNWKFILGTNVCLGLMLCLGLVSDYSWNARWANTVFPPFVGLVGLLSICRGRKVSKETRRWSRILCLPSVILGMPYAAFLVIAAFPPLLFGTFLWIAERDSAKVIQEAWSPDGTKRVEVCFLPVGPYSAGEGRIEVHLSYRWLPFVKRDIYYLSVSRADESVEDYLWWEGNSALFLSETRKRLHFGVIQWRMPVISLNGMQ